jgi:protein-tyrosine phosphatase
MSDSPLSSPHPEGRVAFDGALNFRDFGGQSTRDGRRVARGRLYRSDALWQLSDADLERFDALGIRTVCDFRAEHERQRWPNRLPSASALRSLGLGFTPLGTQSAWDAVNRGELSAEGVRAYMRDHYRALADAHTEFYVEMFRALLEPDAVPFLVHCASGKDRTGFAAAIILLSVGVDRDAVLADYVLSNRYRRDLWHLFHRQVDPGAYDAVGAAAPEYLEASFEVIDQRHGGEGRYLREVMRLSDADRERLRSLLLE